MPAMIAHPGMPLWVDLLTSDVDVAKSFYSDVLGWEFDAPIGGVDHNAGVARKSGMPVAGIVPGPSASGNEPAGRWMMMLYTPDVVAAYKGAVAAGAGEILPPQDLGPAGAAAVIADPSGALVGLRAPGDEQAILAAGEPGTPVWFELYISANWEKTLEFYHELAGWDIRTGGEGDGERFGVGEIDGQPVAGFIDAASVQPEEAPQAMWSVHFGVADVEEAAKTVADKGGAVLAGPLNTSLGRAVLVADAVGAHVGLCEVPEFVPEDHEHEPDLFAPEGFTPN